MKALVIEKADIRHNVAILRDRAGSAALYAVLAGDGQGTGLVEMAKALREEGIGRFAVSEMAEAVALRKAGLVEEEILMLRSIIEPGELELAMDYNIVCTIGSNDAGVALNGLAEARSTVVEAHIQVDTGMGFGGFLATEPDKILSMYRYLPNVALSGIYTQMHGAKGGQKQAEGQLGLFQSVLDAIHEAGFETGTVHAAGSSAFLHYEFATLDAVRAGSALFGRCHQAEKHDLKPVGYGRATLGETHWLPKGHTVGSDKLITLRKPTRVALMPVGYQHGFGVITMRRSGFWAWMKQWRRPKPQVVVAGQLVKIIGQIGAFETLLDVTDLKCSPGDTVTFTLEPLHAKGLKVEYK